MAFFRQQVNPISGPRFRIPAKCPACRKDVVVPQGSLALVRQVRVVLLSCWERLVGVGSSSQPVPYLPVVLETLTVQFPMRDICSKRPGPGYKVGQTQRLRVQWKVQDGSPEGTLDEVLDVFRPRMIL